MLTHSISVAICCFNAECRIEQTLKVLANCLLPGPVELLIIDNNSTDRTIEVAKATWSAMSPKNFPMRVVEECSQGLSFARQRAASEAAYPIILFCDDDNLLDKDYLVFACDLMQDEKVGAASGVGAPISSEDFPAWFFTFAEFYAVGLQRPELLLAEGGQLDITDTLTRCPWGAGYVTRKELLEAVFKAPYVPLLADRSGTALTSGGDYEIGHLVAASGKRLVIDGRLNFQHNIPAERITLSYLSRLLDGQKQQFSGLSSYETARTFIEIKKSKKYFIRVLIALSKFVRRKANNLDRLIIADVFSAERYLLNDIQRKALSNVIFVSGAAGRG